MMGRRIPQQPGEVEDRVGFRSGAARSAIGTATERERQRPSPVIVVAPPKGPGIGIRAVWFLFIGWWLAGW